MLQYSKTLSISVNIYCATVGVSSVTAPSAQYSDYDGTVDVCSGDHDSGVANHSKNSSSGAGIWDALWYVSGIGFLT